MRDKRRIGIVAAFAAACFGAAALAGPMASKSYVDLRVDAVSNRVEQVSAGAAPAAHTHAPGDIVNAPWLTSESDPLFSSWRGHQTNWFLEAGGTAVPESSRQETTVLGGGPMLFGENSPRSIVIGSTPYGSGGTVMDRSPCAIGIGWYLRSIGPDAPGAIAIGTHTEVCPGHTNAVAIGGAHIGYGAKTHGANTFNISAQDMDHVYLGDNKLMTLVNRCASDYAEAAENLARSRDAAVVAWVNDCRGLIWDAAGGVLWRTAVTNGEITLTAEADDPGVITGGPAW